MKKFTYTAFVFVAAIMAGCANSNNADYGIPEPSVKYVLPVTSAKITVDLLLKECRSGSLLASQKVTILPVAQGSNSETEQFEISGEALRSFSKRRVLEISLHDHGTIKSINATTTDKTPEILGNILKIGGFVLGLDAENGVAGSAECKSEVTSALTVARSLEEKISQARVSLRSADVGVDVENITRQINSWAGELAQIQTDYLRLTLASEILLEQEKPLGTIYWNQDKFEKWLVDPSDKATKQFALGYCVYEVSDPRLQSCTQDAVLCYADSETCDDGLGEDDVSPVMAALDADDESLAAVPIIAGEMDSQKEMAISNAMKSAQLNKDAIVFREPASALVQVYALYPGFVRTVEPDLLVAPGAKGYESVGLEKKIGNGKLKVSQWGDISIFPLTVSFGGSNSLEMTLDAFGSATKYGWTSEATGPAITGAVASGFEGVSKIIEAERAEDIKKQKAEIDELETQQKLNKLRACEAVISNGGFECPE